MPKPSVRVGVIGLGAIAERAHLPGFAACRGAQLVALSSARKVARRTFGDRYAIEQRYEDWRELLTSDSVDAVAICTRNDEHFAMAALALEQGKHVLLEKPITTRVAEATRLVALARRARRVLHVHHNLRFQAAALRAHTALCTAAIGELVAFEAVLSHRGPRAWAPHAKWFFDARRVGGGVLLDLGVHVFDLLRFLSGEEVSQLTAQTFGAADASGGKAEHHANCLLVLANGAKGSVSVSWREASYRNRYRFLGTRGALELDLAQASVSLEQAGKRRELTVPSSKRSAQQAFIAAIQGDARGALHAARGEDGAHALRLALAALASAQTSRSTRLRPLSFAR
ncbi:MAG: Gfo/Idh/MocA family protein [Myxococcota bacterium]